MEILKKIQKKEQKKQFNKKKMNSNKIKNDQNLKDLIKLMI